MKKRERDTCLLGTWIGCPAGSVEISNNAKFLNGYCFFIALGGKDQDGFFSSGLVSHLAGWNFIKKKFIKKKCVKKLQLITIKYILPCPRTQNLFTVSS